MFLKPVVRGVAASVLLVVIAVCWFELQVHPIFSSHGKEVIVTVKSGDSLSTIAGELHSAGVIASPFAFRLDNALHGSFTVGAGSYQLREGSSFPTVRSVLRAGPNVLVVTASPGTTLHEIAITVAADKGNAYAEKFLADATASVTPSTFGEGSSLEGLIGAGQYVLPPDETAKALASAMVSRFETQAAGLGLTPSTHLNGLDAYQLIVAASIVEKEGYYPHNMPKVARVIFNRLARGGPLQMDSTVLYYLGQDGGTVTASMLQQHEPYNTYLNLGLTPTPICVVSNDALKAVLHAPAGPWLYFTLIDKQGDMAFSSTFAQQLRNEALAAKRGVA